jgi:hypothetical protein
MHIIDHLSPKSLDRPTYPAQGSIPCDLDYAALQNPTVKCGGIGGICMGTQDGAVGCTSVPAWGGQQQQRSKGKYG